MLQEGDLVRTREGDFGIVLDLSERLVFLGNGLTHALDADDWENLEQCRPRASFVELVRSHTAGRLNREMPGTCESMQSL